MKLTRKIVHIHVFYLILIVIRLIFVLFQVLCYKMLTCVKTLIIMRFNIKFDLIYMVYVLLIRFLRVICLKGLKV